MNHEYLSKLKVEMNTAVIEIYESSFCFMLVIIEAHSVSHWT